MTSRHWGRVNGHAREIARIVASNTWADRFLCCHCDYDWSRNDDDDDGADDDSVRWLLMQGQ